MKKIHVYTSAACNYIPKVRMLAESVRRWHPEWVMHLALSDELPEGIDLSAEPFDEVHPAAALGIPDFQGWAFCHSIVELSTAIKPFVLQRLLDREDCAGVIFLDPDTVLFSRIDEVPRVLEASNIALTPHLTLPEETLDAVMDNEISSLKHGVYNLGFLAVAPTPMGKAFAEWWGQRMYHFCRADIPNGLFTDQRWIDLVPAFFEGVCILRTPRLNVAPWNLTQRSLSGSAPDAVAVDGEPLGFYHFTGFDSGAHRTMVRRNAPGNPTVDALVDWYDAATQALGKDPLARVAWRFGRYADGTAISAAARLVYRERLDLQKAFADPFASTASSGFRGWWETQGRIEYPELFAPAQAQVVAAMDRLRQALTPGFRAGAGAPRWDAKLVSGHLRQAMGDAEHRRKLTRRAWEILRTEGLAGVRRRLARH
ncbi:MAG: glycosyl transferase [Pseudomonadota bacterium]